MGGASAGTRILDQDLKPSCTTVWIPMILCFSDVKGTVALAYPFKGEMEAKDVA